MTERPTPEQLRKLLRYEPETGKLFWLPRPESMFSNLRYYKAWNTTWANKEAFTCCDTPGYKKGKVLGYDVSLHRVACALYYGYWPEEQIDHINGDRTDNRISNLRCVSQTENMRNKKRYLTNTSGHTGVSWSKAQNAWKASICVDQKTTHLGYFTNIEDAAAARKAAEEGHGFTERHGK